jgi:hypothetical protein
MIALSPRHARAVVALAAIAALPITWHALAAPITDDCRDPEALMSTEQIGALSVIDRQPPLDGPLGVRRITGGLRVPGGDLYSMGFRVSRGFTPSDYYGLLEVHDMDKSFSLDAAGERIAIDADGTALPVRWLEDTFERNFRVRAHFLVYDGRPIASPFAAGVATAGRQLVHGTLPVTMFAFHAAGPASARDAMRDAAREWLRAAWALQQRACEGGVD